MTLMQRRGLMAFLLACTVAALSGLRHVEAQQLFHQGRGVQFDEALNIANKECLSTLKASEPIVRAACREIESLLRRALDETRVSEKRAYLLLRLSHAIENANINYKGRLGRSQKLLERELKATRAAFGGLEALQHASSDTTWTPASKSLPFFASYRLRNGFLEVSEGRYEFLGRKIDVKIFAARLKPYKQAGIGGKQPFVEVRFAGVHSAELVLDFGSSGVFKSRVRCKDCVPAQLRAVEKTVARITGGTVARGSISADVEAHNRGIQLRSNRLAQGVRPPAGENSATCSGEGVRQLRVEKRVVSQAGGGTNFNSEAATNSKNNAVRIAFIPNGKHVYLAASRSTAEVLRKNGFVCVYVPHLDNFGWVYEPSIREE